MRFLLVPVLVVAFVSPLGHATAADIGVVRAVDIQGMRSNAEPARACP